MERKGLGFAVIGAGRIGALHARHLAGAVDGAQLVCVMDASLEAAKRASYGGAYVTEDLARVLKDENVDAVVIASPTNLHAEQLEACAEAGKAIFCEKPIALDLQTTLKAMAAVERADVPFQIGFNRRFDPGYRALAEAVHAGEIGKVEIFRSQSSDPQLPSPEYIASSGGLYIDSVIHDIDTARFIGGEITRVTALGRVLVDPVMERLGDIDTSILTLEFASGALGVVLNSRRTVHGYDLRVEVHGEKGKLVTEDERATKLWRYDKNGIHGNFYYYFLERFRDAYREEVQAFVTSVQSGKPASPGTKDALESLRVAIAATRSLKEGRPVNVSEIS